MPVFSYLAYPVQGSKAQLLNDLAALGDVNYMRRPPWRVLHAPG